MAKKEIFIIGSDRNSGGLTLSDGGETKVYNKDHEENRKIIWEIDDQQKEEVRSFLLEVKDAGQNPPFDTAVPRHHDTQVRLKVKKDTPPIEWNYNIIWRDRYNNDHTYDPKISVLPSPLASSEPDIEA